MLDIKLPRVNRTMLRDMKVGDSLVLDYDASRSATTIASQMRDQGEKIKIHAEKSILVDPVVGDSRPVLIVTREQ